MPLHTNKQTHTILYTNACLYIYVHTFALGPLFISLGSGFFGRVGLVDGVTLGGTGLGGAELFLNVGGSGLLGLKKDAKHYRCIHRSCMYAYRSGDFLMMLLLELVLVVVVPFIGLLPVYSLPSFAVCLRNDTTMES